MAMVEVQVGGLIDAALDWVMATIEELPIRHDPMAFGRTANGGYWVWYDELNGMKCKIGPGSTGPRATLTYSPSTNWSQLGPLILKYPIVLGNHESGLGDGNFWGSAHCGRSDTTYQTSHGVMVAACRAIIAFVRGPVVSVPAELICSSRSAEVAIAGGNADE